MKVLLVLLVIGNLLLYGWFQGWLSPYGGDGREPQRVARQVMPERVRIAPGVPPAEGSTQGSPARVESGARGTEPVDTNGSAVSAPLGPVLPMPPEAPAGSALQAVAEPPAWLAAGCTELGPITEAQALSIQTAIAMPGVHATMLLPAGTETWWVYVWPPTGEAQTRLDALRARKLVEEVVLMREGGLRGAIVMGRFKEVANALALQRKLILAGETDVRLAARGGPPATTLLRIQWSSPESLRNAAAAGSGPLVLPASPFSEGLAAQLEQQRDALRAAGSPATLKACPADQATAFSSRR
jgi:hypothetical protein